ncbi:MATE family efflux transporter [Phenylobacterium sp.]|uniref:MATE family efflux transporter n=1 Tax=Phenylobacterium sp. TaxID=1871053 RepID=UPI0027347EFC|nr:MATE family efflux transporter [Phenylobacterium sp.]MDP3660509.1 MATE family efflux transporter [Phenylobacterium sp.]
MTEPAAPAQARPAPPGRRPGRDLTSGPIGKTLILFALPLLGSNVLQSLNGSANAIWVSHSLGEAALTATSNANQIFFLMLGAAFGATMAANILIGQAIGAGDPVAAKRVVGTATAFFILLSLVIGASGALLTPAILTLMGTPADARENAIIYLRVIFSAMPFMYFFSFLMMAQRATGDSRTPFYFSLLSVGLDIVLNPLLIMGIGPFPRMGIAGSATSTLIAQTTTLAMILIHLYRTNSILVLRPSEWGLLKPDFIIVKALVLKGMPMALQMMVTSLAAVSMMSFVNRYGSHTAAAYGAAAQLWTYVQMPALAMSGAVSSMAAQNVGANRMDRVERAALIGSAYAILLTATPVLLIYAVEPYVLRLFLPGASPSLPIAMHINSYALWGFIPFGIAFVLAGTARATGAVWPPLVAMALALWGVRIPFAVLLQSRLGADAVWMAFPLGGIATCVFALAYYRWGGWRKARMMDTRPRGSLPDTGLSPPIGFEETEAAEEAAEALVSRDAPSSPNRPGS